MTPADFRTMPPGRELDLLFARAVGLPEDESIKGKPFIDLASRIWQLNGSFQYWQPSADTDLGTGQALRYGGRWLAEQGRWWSLHRCNLENRATPENEYDFGACCWSRRVSRKHNHGKDAPMLVLSRKVGESIYIGEGPQQVRVMLIEIQRGKVRLGIDAPRTVPIYREELRRIECSICNDPKCDNPNGKH
jgi:carbon storage regulator